jgi:site-specific recombinase XerD
MKTSIKYYLEIRNSSEDKWPLVLSCCYKGRRMKMHTGIKLHEKHWDAKNYNVLSLCDEADAINSFLLKLRELAVLQVDILAESGIPEVQALRQSIKSQMPVPGVTFFEAFVEYMEYKNPEWASTTFTKVKTLYNLLRQYNTLTDNKLQIQSFSSTDFHLIENYFHAKRKLSGTSTVNYLGILKGFLNWAESKSYYKNLGASFKAKNAVSEVSNTPIRYLHRDDLFKIYDLRGLGKKEERIRDIFCFICFTGLRYSKLKQLRKSDFIVNRLRLSSGKRQEFVPLNQTAIDILSRYAAIYFRNDSLFPVFSEITINRYLKIIGDKARINIAMSNEATANSLSKTIKPLTIGVARNTFIMNGLSLGLGEESLVRLLGAKSKYSLSRFKVQLQEKDATELMKFNQL